MNQNNHSELRYARLTVEAVLKSLLCGLVAGFGAVFATGAIFWIIGTRNLALVIGLLLGALAFVTSVIGVILYFAKFRPTINSNAKRIDSLGLEERAITMIELQNDDSIMAQLQRNDALTALSTVNQASIKFNIGRKMIAVLSITATISIAMGTVSSLSAAGLIPNPSELIERNEPPVYIPVSYEAEDGGRIEGETEQLVLMGESAETVVAIPDEGYSFEGWDDGYVKPTRTDENIDHPLVLIAIFLPLEEEDDEDMDGEHGENGDAPGDEESDSGESPGQSDTPGDKPSDTGGDASVRDQNFIIDGTDKNDYKLHLPEAKEKIMELLKKSIDELTEEERAIIEAYINIL